MKEPALALRSFAAFAAAFLVLSGCARLLSDNGVELAGVLEDGATKLRSANASELTVRYETLDGGTDPYYVEITPSFTFRDGQTSSIPGSYIVVSGGKRGGTSSHNPAVIVPQRLYIEKPNGGPTYIVLRKDGDRIDVVELR